MKTVNKRSIGNMIDTVVKGLWSVNTELSLDEPRAARQQLHLAINNLKSLEVLWTAELIARDFHRRIRDVLNTDELNRVDETNRTEDGNCATQDHVDANVYMGEALESVLEREQDFEDEGDSTLWGRAWDRAKGVGFSNEWPEGL